MTTNRPRDAGTAASRSAKGKRAEEAVADYLVARGFDLLGRNVRFGALEIDILARCGSVVVIVEVRTRGGGAFARGLESVGRRKQEALVRAAQRLWVERIASMKDVTRMRIDVASVTFDREGTHVEYVPAAITA